MANALVGNIKQGRADAAEQAGVEGATNKFNSLDLAKILSGGQAAYPSSVAAGSSPTSAAATNTPVSIPKAPEIRQGLVDRGLPEHVADAFVLNFQDESGLNPAINERNPVVAGSRGGYGLYQLTGPRRREYEAFAAQRGVAPSDTNAQLDFLMQEGRTTEKAAFDKILASPDTGSAAQAIVNNFLRPAEEHRAARAARYGQVANTAPSTAADAINMIAPPESQGISQDQFNSRFNGAPEAQPVQPQAMQQPDPMPTGALPQAPQSQFSDSAIQQHDAMFGGALAPAGTALQQAPAGQGYFPDAPAMGSYAAMAPQQGGNQLQALMAAASDPFLNDSQQGMINMALQQQLQNSDPMRQMQMQKLQRDLNMPAKRNTTNINGNLVDADTGQVIANFPEQTKPTSDIQNYEYARQNGFVGTFDQYQQMVKKAGASSTNVSVGEGDKFYEALDKKNAETFSSLSDTGVQARSKLAQIDRLRGLMAASPTGAAAALKLAAGEYGIKTDDLDDLQASQALINELVPQQRQPGSGPMSDADLALFKQSLPRIINTPDGNNLILDTMTGITQYQIQMGDIADRVANREITAAQGRELIKSLKNPLEGFRKSSKDIGAQSGNRTSSGVQWSIEP
ncbi:flagellar biosynthesis protein FlgJ [Ochrobactrum sp. SFR4]|nr:flagellar biosynthesis protein FlgJ [Ochrobactrum sp. SFR4]